MTRSPMGKALGVLIGAVAFACTIKTESADDAIPKADGGAAADASIDVVSDAAIAPQEAGGPSSCPSEMRGVRGGGFDSAWSGKKHLSDFCLDANEVTTAEFTKCVEAGMCSAPGACNYGVADRGDHPINCVDWNQAKAYCEALGKRLPLEAEWEWAARGGASARKLPWGDVEPSAADEPERLCWRGKTPRPTTCPVGSFPSGDSADGIHDLAGNVWEWVDGDFNGKSYRGASFHTHLETIQETHTDYRDGSAVTNRGENIGFRCARDGALTDSLTVGLVGYWPFDGDALDASGADRHLTVNGAASFGDGRVGKALALHGSVDEYAARATSDAELDWEGRDFSIQIWVNYTTVSSEQTLVEKFTGANGPGWTLTSADNTRALFYSTGGLATTPVAPASLQAGVWHHVVAVRKAGTVTITYDGVVAGTGAVPALTSSNNPLLVGKRNSADGRGFAVNGRLDELALWSRALTDDEIAALYAGGAGLSMR